MKSLLVATVLVTLVGVSLAELSLKDLVEALKNLDKKSSYKRELDAYEHNIAHDLLDIYRRAFEGCGGDANDSESRKSGCFNTQAKSENSQYICEGITPGSNKCNEQTGRQICQFSCRVPGCMAKCQGQTKRSFYSTEDEEFAMKLYHNFQEMIKNVKN